MPRIRPRRASFPLGVSPVLGALTMATVASGCRTPATGVLLVLDADAPPARPMSIDVRVVHGAGLEGGALTRLSRGTGPAPAGVLATELPASLGIVPRAGGTRMDTVTLVVSASIPADANGDPAIAFRRIARFAFLPGASGRLPLMLSVSCGSLSAGCTTVPASECTVSVRCEETGRTCGDRGTCDTIDVTPEPIDRDAHTDVARSADAQTSVPEVVASGREPFGIASDGTTIFFAQFGDGAISRLGPTATAGELLGTGGVGVFGLVYEGNALLWAANGSGTIHAMNAPAPSSTIQMLGTMPGVRYVAADADNVYFGSDNSTMAGVYRLPRAGGTPVALVSGVRAHAIAVRNGTVFFGSASDGVIGRVAAAGGPATQLATGEQGLWGIAADDTHVYWTNHDTNIVARVPALGGPREILADGQAGAHGLLLDGTTLYWTADTAGTVMRLPLGDVPHLVARGQGSPKHLAMAGGFLYWTNYGGDVMRIRP